MVEDEPISDGAMFYEFLHVSDPRFRLEVLANSVKIWEIQSISDIRPAFLDNQNGPYKQYGPISGNTLEEGPGEEVKGLISMEM